MYVASKLKEQVNDPVTQADIRDASLAACAALPEGMMRDACTSFIEQYGEQQQQQQQVYQQQQTWLRLLMMMGLRLCSACCVCVHCVMIVVISIDMEKGLPSEPPYSSPVAFNQV
jgi:hypothetical protein